MKSNSVARLDPLVRNSKAEPGILTAIGAKYLSFSRRKYQLRLRSADRSEDCRTGVPEKAALLSHPPAFSRMLPARSSLGGSRASPAARHSAAPASPECGGTVHP